jgi:hypothetical protein
MRTKTLFAIVFSVASILPCSQLRSQDAASAKAFLENAYRHYQNGGNGIDFNGTHSSLYFQSSLLALEKADVKANGPDNVSAIDWNPLCGCQDWGGGIFDLKIEIRVENPRQATAEVSILLSDPNSNRIRKSNTLLCCTFATMRKLDITLVPEHGQWRIYDVLDKSDPKFTSSVRQLLQKDLAALRSHPVPVSH